MKKMHITLLLTFIIVVAAVQQGCKKDHGDPPTIPPKSSLEMNFSDIDSSKTNARFHGMKTDSIGQYSNFLFAAGNVFGWDMVLIIGLAVPVASFDYSFTQQASWNKHDNAWEWNYNFTSNITYSAKLEAKVSGSTVHWEMYISQQGGFQNFMWYEGDSQIDNSQGTWTLFDNPWSNKQLLGIVWHRNTSAGTSDITYTNIVPGGAENGGYIAYGLTTDTTYNAYYNIYNKGKNNLTGIKWNTTHKNGRVNDLLNFGDSNWHCWDMTYKNDTCL